MEWTKKERPEAATSGRSVQGLASENNRKIMITRFARKCKPRTSAGEGGDLSMTGWEFFFVVLGVCSATSGLFRVIDRIEGK